MEALEHGAVESGRKGVFNAHEWSKEWLQTAGLNTLNPVFECQHGKIHKFCVHQVSLIILLYSTMYANQRFQSLLDRTY